MKTGKQLSLKDVVPVGRWADFEVKEKQWIIDHEADQLLRNHSMNLKRTY